MRQLPNLVDFYPPSPPAHAGGERALDRPLSLQESTLLTDALMTLCQRGITAGDVTAVYLQHPDFSVGNDHPASTQPAGYEAIRLRQVADELANGTEDEEWVRREIYVTTNKVGQWLLKRRLN